MSRQLRISHELALPLEWAQMATIVYGGRGTGKTFFGSVAAEEVWKQHVRFCAIDVKGDWWGLKSSADGKSEGIPVVVFGGDHQDVPLDENAGGQAAEIVAGLEQPVIIDLERLSKGKQIKFLAAFFEKLYDVNRNPILLLLDEIQRYAPQTIRFATPEMTMCLGAVEDLVKLGRKHGIGVIGFTQRGAGVNKEVSELCDLLMAFRTPGPLDQGRVREWLEANVTLEEQKVVMSKIAGLDTGTAIIASGHPQLKVFKTVGIRARETFDSSATPKIGVRRMEPKVLSKPDLEQLTIKMAATLAKAKANDPREKDKVIAQLQGELRRKDVDLKRYTEHKGLLVPKEVIKQQRVEVPVLKPADVERIVTAMQDFGTVMDKTTQQLVDRLSRWSQRHNDVIGLMERAVKDVQRMADQPMTIPVRPTPPPEGERPAQLRPAAPARPQASIQNRPRDGADGVSRPQQKILDGLAWLETVGTLQAPWNIVAWISDQSPKSSGFEKNISTLRTAGLIEGPRTAITLSPLGREGAVAPPRPLTEESLRQMIYAKISGPQVKMLEALVQNGGRRLSWEELAEASIQSPTSSGFEKNVSTLRTLELIDGKRATGFGPTSKLFLYDPAAA